MIVVEDDRLEEYLVLPFSDIFTQIIRQRNPEIALFAATTSGRELAPRIGMKTGSAAGYYLRDQGEMSELLDRIRERLAELP